MATQTADIPRSYQLGDLEEYPVIASDIIYEGAAVGENAAGYSRPLVALDPFQGFCIENCDNSTGAAGDKLVKVKTRGKIVLTVTGASAITVNDRPAVYASDDNTFTLTLTGNTKIGYVQRWVAGSQCVVEFDALRVLA